jgi:hypothetical protein
MGAFDDIERTYLEGPYGAEDVARILAGGVVLGVGKDRDEVGWRDSLVRKDYHSEWPSLFVLRSCPPAETASGNDLLIETPTNGTLVVNGSASVGVDIFASNGMSS